MKKKSTLLHFNKIALCCLLFLFTALRASSQTNWYYNGSGNLTATTSWGSNNDGSGSNPADFITNNYQFIIMNTSSVSLTGTWTVSGTSSKVILGNPVTPAAPITLTLNSGSVLTVPSASFDVSIPSSGTQKIIYKNSSAISLGTVNDANLELVFDGATLTTSTAKTFGNVSLINNAVIDMGAASAVFNNLTINAGSILSGPIGSSSNFIAIKTGGAVVINGTFKTGRTGTVTSPGVGGLYTTGVAIPVVANANYATLLFQDAATTPALTLGNASTIEYYRGTSGQVGTQGITPMAYANLILSNSTTASNKSFAVPGNITVSGTMTINLLSGATITQPSSTTNVTLLPKAKLVINSATAFPTNGKLTLQSDVTGTASIGTCITGSAITGNVTVQQYIPGGFRKYRFLSHPFTTAQTLSQLTDNIDITGNTAGTTNVGGQTAGSGFTSTSTNNPSAYYFTTANANGGSPNDGGWSAFLDATTSSWAKAQGMRLLIRGPKGQTGTLDGANATPNAVTLDMSGIINTGDVLVNLVTGGAGATAGFNMVGNPYPSPVDVGTVLNNASNIGSSFYLRNPQTGSYITVPVAAGYTIPGSTAFFIKANAATTLTFTETNKSTCTSCATLFRNNNVQKGLQIKAIQNSLEYDNLYLNIGKYSSNYDENNDAIKLTNDALNVYVLSSDNKKLAADYRNIENNDIIPLGISLPIAYGVQTYTLKVSDVNMDNQTTLILHDKLNNIFTELKENSIYNLQVDPSNAASVGDNRLEIIVMKNNVHLNSGSANLYESIDVFATTNTITITNNSSLAIKQANLTLLNIDGKNISTQVVNLEAGESISIAAKQFAAGMYAIQLLMADGKIAKKFFKP